MPSEKKIHEVAALSELVRGATGYYFLDFTGVEANDFNVTRRQLRSAGARIRVVKNRLALRALVENGVGEEVARYLKGPTSVVIAREDAIVPARVLKEVARKLTTLKIKGAYVDKTFFDAGQFEFLASLPTKADLRVQLVGVLAAPISDLAWSLEGLLNEFVFIIEQLGERQTGTSIEAQDGAPA